MDCNRQIEENNKRLYNPHTGSLMEAVKKRKLMGGIENILPSPGLIGPPQKDPVQWPAPPIACVDIESLVVEAKMAEQERQQRINRATYETTSLGPIREQMGTCMSTRVKVKQMPKIDLNQERRRIAAMKSMVFEKKVKNAPKLDLAKNLLLKRRQLAVGSLRETEVSNDSPYSVKLESHMYSLQVTPV